MGLFLYVFSMKENSAQIIKPKNYFFKNYINDPSLIFMGSLSCSTYMIFNNKLHSNLKL